MKDFPFKTLIWACVVVIALFLFKSFIGPMLIQLEEVEILGNVKLKLNKEDIKNLKKAEEKYKLQIADLTQSIEEQQAETTDLIQTVEKLKKVVKKCDKNNKEAKDVANKISEIKQKDSTVRVKLDVLKNTHVIKDIPNLRMINQ